MFHMKMTKTNCLKLSLLLLFSLATACDNREPEVYEEPSIQMLYGNYRLTKIHWTGYPVELNYDKTTYHVIQREMEEKIGYYEPNYIADVAKGESYEDEDYTVFNVTLPYPYYFYSEDRWYCSCIRDFQMSLTGDNKFFELGGLNCPAYPNYLQSNDLFLAGIANVGVVVEAFEDESFDVRLHCVLPYDNPYNNEQSLNYGYLYYTFTKVD